MENDSLRDEAASAKVMMQNADAAVKSQIDQFMKLMVDERARSTALQRQLLDLSKLNRKLRAEMALERKKKENCESCRTLKLKLRGVQEELNALQEQHLDSKQRYVEDSNNQKLMFNAV